MKKIITAVAAVAMAATIFAADISASVGLKSSLFNVNVTTGEVTVLDTLANKKTADYATLFSLQANVDRAGGGVKYWAGTGADGTIKNVVYAGKWNVWFKPTDALKLSFLDNKLALFGDKFNGYEAHEVAAISEGYGIQYVLDSVTIDFNFAPAFLKNNTVGEFGTKIGFNGDFGSLAAIFGTKNNCRTFILGAGYSGNIESLGLTATAGAEIGTSSVTMKSTVSAGTTIDALSLAGCTFFTMNTSSAKPSLGLEVSAAYQFDACKAKAYFKDSNLIADKFDCTVGVELTGNVGAASWKIDPNYNVGKNTIDIAFETGINF